MSAHPRVLGLWRSARLRRMLIRLGLGLPWLVLALAAVWRSPSLVPLSLLILVLALLAAGLWRAHREIDLDWVRRQLNAHRPDLEDSVDLVLAPPATLTGLQALQRGRVDARLATQPLPRLLDSWPPRRLGLSLLLAVGVALVAYWWPAAVDKPPTVAPAVAIAAEQGLRVVSQQLRILPPTYTGLPARDQSEWNAKVPQDATVRWSIGLKPTPGKVSLLFHDGQRIDLSLIGDLWTGSRAFARSSLYRLEVDGKSPGGANRRQRIEVIADRPPQLRVIQPDRSLTLLTAGQSGWPLRVEATDDYGLGSAHLRITLAQGSGENISVSARTIALPGQGSSRLRSYARRLDLRSLGFAAGDDLVVRLTVTDNRRPQPQTSRTASFILRWPPPTPAEASGVEGLVKRALPAYFRSQRQIIIDSEALLAERRKLAADRFATKSDEIGVDQRILRLRYGQFLGEEAEEGRSAPATGAGKADSHETEEHGEPAATTPADAGVAAIVHDFGHTHDIKEAATLLDPGTRETLRSALNEMWQAELHLRQGEPALALPFEYRALRLIKQVQQASRIYLARVGLELPPIDESRRLTGVRTGIEGRRDALAPATVAESPALRLWLAVDRPAPRPGPELDAFENWLHERQDSVLDALDLFAAADEWRLRPDCQPCARLLRARLWSLLPARPPAPTQREAIDPVGRRYLDALRKEPKP